MGYKVAIIGLGLVGGSLGLALNDSRLVDTVWGYDLDPETMQLARSIGAIHAAGTLPEAVRGADYVFICTPLKAMASVLREISPWLKAGCTVSDVGSVKVPVGEWMHVLPAEVHAIGGHPMAGSEKSGFAGADRYLFENALYVLCPFRLAAPEAVERLVTLLRETGAQVKILDAAVHDRIVALISHLPHVLACSLLSLAEQMDDGLTLAAGSFRDLTRVASSNPFLWEDILIANRQEVFRAIDSLIGTLQEFKRDLAAAEAGKIAQWLQRGQQIRETIPQRKKGLFPASCEIVVMVPDRPGIIGQLGLWLGEENINIVDIEILRVREGEGGTIRIGLPDKEDVEKALRRLRQEGVKAWQR